MLHMHLQFIYITQDEMEAVANFITSKGRVAIAEIAAKSNMFIDLKQTQQGEETLTVPDLDLGFDDIQAAEVEQ